MAKKKTIIHYQDFGKYSDIALCGYVSKNVTKDKKKVTCKFCKRLLTK